MVFDIENRLWKSNFDAFCQLSITPIFKSKWFSSGMPILVKRISLSTKVEQSFMNNFISMSSYISNFKYWNFMKKCPCFQMANSHLEMYYSFSHFALKTAGRTRLIYKTILIFSWPKQQYIDWYNTKNYWWNASHKTRERWFEVLKSRKQNNWFILEI